MSETRVPVADSWVPQACTLPTAEQPLRLAEFDEFFASEVRSAERLDPHRVRLELTPAAAVAARAADLMVRESRCCAFFTFTLSVAGGRVLLDVAVPAGQTGVVDALAARAGAGAHS